MARLKEILTYNSSLSIYLVALIVIVSFFLLVFFSFFLFNVEPYYLYVFLFLFEKLLLC